MTTPWPDDPIPDPTIDPAKPFNRGGRVYERASWSNNFRDQGGRQRCPDGSPLSAGGICPPQAGGY